MFYAPPLAGILEDLLRSGDEELSSMGWNLLHDRRIDTARFDGFASYLASARLNIACPATMKNAVLRYHTSRVQGGRPPDFLLENLNESNLHGRQQGRVAIYGHRLLVRVLNLSKLGKPFAAAKFKGVDGFDDYLLPSPAAAPPGTRPSGGTDSHTLVAWLDHKLARFKNDPSAGFNAALLARDAFLGALFTFMNTHRRSDPYQPVWATGWTEFSSGDWQQPERWPQMLGMRANNDRPVSPSWLLLLRYPAREAGQIVRPTQLDAGWHPAHFPIPPSAPTGHAMDLDHTQRDHHPLPEYIHQQMDHTPAHLVACARVEAAPPMPLPTPQLRHYRLLENLYPDVPAWTQRPHPASAP